MIDWNTPTLMVFGPSEDCGCPMEEWIYKGLSLLMHFEPGKQIDLYAEGDGWDLWLPVNSREEAFAWVDALPHEDELAA